MDSLLDLMYNMAQNQSLIKLIVETLILRSKLTIVRQDFDLVNDLLAQAELSAHESGLNRLMIMAETERKVISKQMKQLSILHEKGETLIEIINKTEIKDYLNNMIKMMEQEDLIFELIAFIVALRYVFCV